MYKFMVATLSVVAVFYIFLAEVDKPIDEIALIATAPQSAAGLGEPGDSDPLTPLRISATEAPRSETLTTSEGYEGYVGPATTTELNVASIADPDARTASLRRLADHNMAQLYAVLWQSLELEEPDDADFYKFVLATLEDLGDHAPGEILAALVQTAPTPALRLSALRLLAEASQELSVRPFNQALDDPDPEIHRFAQAFFEDLNANVILDAVADAVLDSNREVRMAAFSTLEDMYEFAPVWKVADSVLDDPDPQIRKRALELLTYGDHQAASEHLALALGDPNQKIRELAGDLLAELEQGPS